MSSSHDKHGRFEGGSRSHELLPKADCSTLLADVGEATDRCVVSETDVVDVEDKPQKDDSWIWRDAMKKDLWRSQTLKKSALKVHCHAIPCFFVDFFVVENGSEETRGRGAGQRVAGLGRTFFFSPLRSFAIDRRRCINQLATCPSSPGRSWV